MHLVEGPHGLRAQPGTHREAKVCVMCLVGKETVTDVVSTIAFQIIVSTSSSINNYIVNK